MASRGRKHSSDNGWEEHGGYVKAKMKKLETQTNNTASSSLGIFGGVRIYVNGYTDPPADVLHQLVHERGGSFTNYYSKAAGDFMVTTRLPQSKIASLTDHKVVKPEWITESVRENRRLPWRNFEIYPPNFRKNERTQRVLHFPTLATPQVHYLGNAQRIMDTTEDIADKNAGMIKSPKKSVQTTLPVVAKTSLPSPSTVLKSSGLRFGNLLRLGSTPTKETSAYTKEGFGDKASVMDASRPVKPDKNLCHPESLSTANSDPSDYLASFYARSRLHHLSTWASNLRDLVRSLRDSMSDSEIHFGQRLLIADVAQLEPSAAVVSLGASGLRKTLSEACRPPVIMHIDMDCFFVSVCLRSKPDLKGLPVAVTHSRGTRQSIESVCGSFSEVASCSYEARKFGIKNGMHLGDARKLCPDLKTVPYDFDAFFEVSTQLYKLVAQFCLDIEAVSCDELYADLTNLLSPDSFPLLAAHAGEADGVASVVNPFLLGLRLRESIFKATGCTATCGFGTNRLLARMATKHAKPNGQAFFIGHSSRSNEHGKSGSCVVERIWRLTSTPGVDNLQGAIYDLAGAGKEIFDRLSISSLPGVGSSTAERILDAYGVSTCGELRDKVPVSQLSRLLGPKTGKRIFDLCHGKDSSNVVLDRFAKSISAEVNYGIRLASWSDVGKFVHSLAVELTSRMANVASGGSPSLGSSATGVLGRCLVIRLLTRRADQPKESIKFMGHGVCDQTTRTVQLPTATNDPTVITAYCMKTIRRIKPDPTDIRGLGFQMQRLIPAVSVKAKMKNGSSNEPFWKPEKSQVLDVKSSANSDAESDCNSQITSAAQSSSLFMSPIFSAKTVGSPLFSEVLEHEQNMELQPEDVAVISSASPNIVPPSDVELERSHHISAALATTSTPMSNRRVLSVNRHSPRKARKSQKKAVGGEISNQLRLTQMMHSPPLDEGTRSRSEIDGINVFAKRSLDDMRHLLAAWISDEPEPQEADVYMLADYLASIMPSNLARVRDILRDFRQLLHSLLPEISPPLPTEDEEDDELSLNAVSAWFLAFERVRDVVDRACRLHYGVDSLCIDRYNFM